MRVLATDGLEQIGVDLLQSEGFEVHILQKGPGQGPNDALRVFRKAFKDFNPDALIVRTATKVTREILEEIQENQRSLRLICCATAGFDNIDVNAATEGDIVVMNVPGGNANAVAEYVIGLVIDLARHISESDRTMRRKKFKKREGIELAGENPKTLGIIGLGHVGRTLAKKARALGMNVLASDPYLAEELAGEVKAWGVNFVDQDTLLQEADFVSLHIDSRPRNKFTIGQAEFEIMVKNDTQFINCSRGDVVDEEAFIDALDRGLRAAADVYQGEPNPNPALVKRLTIATAHSAGSSKESRSSISRDAAEQVVNGLKYGTWDHTINLPPVGWEVKPFMELAKMLGIFAAKLWFVSEPKRFDEIRFKYFGTIKDLDTRIITQAALQGLISTYSSRGAVGLVNARQIAEEQKEFKLSTPPTEEPCDYSNMISMEFIAADTEFHRIDGTSMGKNKIQIVRIDDYEINVQPSDIMLVFINEDRPDVVGKVGKIIGEGYGINIRRMALSDDASDGSAMAVANLGGVIPDEAIEDIEQLEDADGKIIRFAKLMTS